MSFCTELPLLLALAAKFLMMHALGPAWQLAVNRGSGSVRICREATIDCEARSEPRTDPLSVLQEIPLKNAHAKPTTNGAKAGAVSYVTDAETDVMF